MIQFLSKFIYVLQGRRKALAALIGLFLFVSFLEGFSTAMVGPFIALATKPDSVNDNPWFHVVYKGLHLSSPNQVIWVIGTVVMLLFYVKAFLSFNAQKYVFEFGYRQQAELSSKLMRIYMTAPYTYHLSRNSAILINNITMEADRFANGLMMPLLTSISNAVVTFALTALLIFTSPVATLTITGILLTAFIFYRQFKYKFALWGKELSESRAEMIRTINHGLGGLKETQVLGCGGYFEQQLDEHAERYSRSISAALSFSNLPRYMIEAFLITFLILFTFIFLIINKGNNQNLSSVLGVFALASIRLLPASTNLVTAVSGIKLNTYTLDKIYLDLKESESWSNLERQGTKNSFGSINAASINFQKRVVLDQVIYRYPNAARNALQGITLEVKKGQSIGLIGKSGAGKTTLVDVILGLLEPQSGDILVDGNSIYTNLRTWQNLIGYVPQSIFLIDDTLAKNIAFGVPDHLIDQARLQKAIGLAQLSELVEQLSEGIDTIIGERGVLLSGGQRQRIGIARALYHEREILVFDEATAALDNETESLVTEAIKSLSGEKTMIIIAHRLSTIEHCDRVYDLEKGQVVNSGSYREVVLAEEGPNFKESQ
jgi:ABC-type multidrug transport system fused ATPase/permease subunit